MSYSEFNGIDDFLDSVEEKHRNECYEKFICGVLATDQLDKHNEAISLEALKQMEEHINTNGLPLIANHDPRLPPGGTVLEAKLVKSIDGTKNYVFGVMATYTGDFYKPFPEHSNPDESIEGHIGNYSIDAISLSYSHNEIDEEIIAEAIADSPDFINNDISKDIRKAADPITILSIAIPAAYIFPFAKKYMEKNGEAVADLQTKFLGWLGSKITNRIKRRILYKFESPYKGCAVHFIVETDNIEILQEAFSDIERAGLAAEYVISKLESQRPELLVYTFDHAGIKKWIPEYLKVGNGDVYTDKPYLMAVEANMGLSVGAREGS